ncbi:probable methyltransferase PMT26 [Papaver somniferum]|uniref:probable methyltransferase PMT26 n=1 Tax=Papaver somniferum TaxID=3469 RepID=UPI000E7046F1|nr:probable methyltransferase PMT26 [Papaver somniferum]
MSAPAGDNPGGPEFIGGGEAAETLPTISQELSFDRIYSAKELFDDALGFPEDFSLLSPNDDWDVLGDFGKENASVQNEGADDHIARGDAETCVDGEMTAKGKSVVDSPSEDLPHSLMFEVLVISNTRNSVSYIPKITDPEISSTSSAGLSDNDEEKAGSSAGAEIDWRLCNGSVAADYIPCLDNMKAIKGLKSRRHMEYREIHCPKPNSRCLIPIPKGYKMTLSWMKNRDMIDYSIFPNEENTIEKEYNPTING